MQCAMWMQCVMTRTTNSVRRKTGKLSLAYLNFKSLRVLINYKIRLVDIFVQSKFSIWSI